ncbi:hypothetical protein IGS68_21365 [Skermanella sp. TT6]|uniref:Uncharacterized protein n=1 Tax=Skermanella cutis TaxID=2775420 RepID=A0ABX7B2K6_9PROT|nr:hypothetical protein [Skermanella sp. TT6]QQP88551.1 hypothetical protein IGS68_21365 [Skermanella sp. TT6]
MSVPPSGRSGYDAFAAVEEADRFGIELDPQAGPQGMNQMSEDRAAGDLSVLLGTIRPSDLRMKSPAKEFDDDAAIKFIEDNWDALVKDGVERMRRLSRRDGLSEDHEGRATDEPVSRHDGPG